MDAKRGPREYIAPTKAELVERQRYMRRARVHDAMLTIAALLRARAEPGDDRLANEYEATAVLVGDGVLLPGRITSAQESMVTAERDRLRAERAAALGRGVLRHDLSRLPARGRVPAPTASGHESLSARAWWARNR